MTKYGQGLFEKEIISLVRSVDDTTQRIRRLITFYVEVSSPQDYSRLTELLSAQGVMYSLISSPPIEHQRHLKDGLRKGLVKERIGYMD